jgi:hypothetical protein
MCARPAKPKHRTDPDFYPAPKTRIGHIALNTHIESEGTFRNYLSQSNAFFTQKNMNLPFEAQFSIFDAEMIADQRIV